MNWNHLGATLWLRWRILVNRIRRTGKLGNAVFGVLAVLGLCVSGGLFVLGLVLGLELMPKAEPMPLMFVWGGLALGFAFFWMIGLIADLQRSDAMSFKGLLHLPVSLSWVFLYNYLSSFVSLSIALFLPAMLGLWLAMVIVRGPAMLLVLPLLLGYFGMITALTYQLRGWLARLMENKRRGRNLIAVITFCFLLLVQIPNLLNLSRASDRAERARVRIEMKELREAAQSQGPEQEAAEAELARRQEQEAREDTELDRKVSLVARIVPLGWLPWGVRAIFEGRWPTGLLCALGLATITTASLRRSYRTTLAALVGAGGGDARAVPVAAPEVAPPGSDARRAPKTLLVQRSLPFLDERAAGIAFATMRSLLRAPEMKLMLLSPLLLLVLFGVMLSKHPRGGPFGDFSPMTSLGAIAVGLVSIIQLIQNQFGLDRAGFRAYVLSPVPRDRILLGKNVAVAPVGIGVGWIALIGLQVLAPGDPAHVLGACLQTVSAYLLLCMVGNTISILGPMRLREGGMKAANAKWKTILWQMLSMVLVPVALSPLSIPAGLEWFLPGSAWRNGLFPALHALGLLAIFLVYRWLLGRQGELLQDREQHILDVLTRE